MAIQTSIQPFTLWRNLGFAMLCAVFAVWGWYDYEYKIPRLEKDSSAYIAAKDTRAALEKSAEAAPLNAEQLKQMEDAKVVLADVLDVDGRAVAKSLGSPAMYTHLDVTREDDWVEAIARANATFGRIDALVNNAGVLTHGRIDALDRAAWQRTLDVNLTGTLYAMQACAGYLLNSFNIFTEPRLSWTDGLCGAISPRSLG